MSINETVTLKAAGSGLVRTIGFPLKESFSVLDVATLRLVDGATILPATFTVGSRWKGLPSDNTKAIKWGRVTFKDTSTARNLTIVDTGAAPPAQTNPLVVTNNTNDITVSNGVITAVFNKVTDSPNLLTSFLNGATEVLHATNKPQITVPVEKKTVTTWTSGSLDYAAAPADATVKVGNASLFTVGETINTEWEGTVGDYYPTGGDAGKPFIIMAAPFNLPEMTRALRTSVHGISIILDYGGANVTVPIDYSQSQGFCLLSTPSITPTAGMKIRIVEVEAIPTLTIQSINTGANTLTFTAPIGQYLPQGVNIFPTVAGSSTAQAQIVAGGTTVEKTYGDKAVIIKQVCHLKDSGARIENNLTFEIRYWLYADTGFVRQKITVRNTVQVVSTNACPPIFFSALNFDFPTAAAATAVTDSVLDMTTSVARYKANNLHSTLNHSAIGNFQFAIHEFQVQWPNKASVNATGCHFEIFPAESGPTSFEGGIIKSRDIFFGVNAGNGLALLDNLGASFDPAYVAATGAVRPNMVEKRDWNTFFASEPQKFRDACARFEKIVSCLYDLTQAQQSFTTRPAMSLYEYRWDYCERAGAQGSYPFGWDRWGNTPDDVGFGNNRYDLPYILFREGLRENTTAKAELAFRLGLQQIRNRAELGQMWNHQSQATGTPDMFGLARYERAYAPDPFNYTNSPIANPTHSWNEGTCLAWALTDDPILEEAARAGVAQARIYDYQGTANAQLYGSGNPQMGTDSNGGNGAEPRFVAWPIHTLVSGYRYFGDANDLTKAQQYTNSFIATLAGEPTQDGFIYFRSGSTIQPLFQHGGYCVMGMIEAWRESVGAAKTAIGDYIVKVAKFLAYGNAQSSSITPNSPFLTAGVMHPTDNTKYLPASHMPFTYLRSFADTLAAPIGTSDTTFVLNDASTFNLNLNVKRGVIIPAGGLDDPTTWEYFTYTGATSTNLTGVVRGFSGSGAKAFPAGAIVYPTAFNNIENDLVIATIIMGARISGDANLQTLAQKIWEDNCLYSKRIDGGNPDFVTVGNYQPVNTWPLSVSSNGLKTMAQAGLSLSEFLGDRVNPPTGPALTNISPISASAGAAQFILTVNGSDFANDAVVRWNGTALTTTFVSATQLTAVVTAPLIANPGSASVSVLNVLENLSSNALTFTINPLPPTVTSLFPDTKNAGDGSFVLIVNGSNFAANSTVTVAGTARTATFVSAVRLDVQVLAADVATAGNKPIVVTNPTSGLSSTAFNLIVNGAGAPAPAISSLSQSSAIVGAGQFTLTVNGTNFVNGAVVKWNGSNRATTFVSTTQLTVIIPATDLIATGTFAVTVTNPDAQSSAGSTFTVNPVSNLVPTVSSISPNSATAGAGQIMLTVNGTNFVPGSVVRWNGTNLVTSFVNSQQLTATISASLLAAAGTVGVTVFNPTPGGGLSSAVTFTINPLPTPELAPSITTVSPASASAGGAQFTLTINGQNFASGAIVRVGGQARQTSFIGTTQLTAIIPATDIQVVASLAITVINPDAQVSNAIVLPVNALNAPTVAAISPTIVTPGSLAFTLAVIGANFTSQSQILVNGVPRTTNFASAQRLETVIAANEVASAGALNISVTTAGVGTSTTLVLPIQTANVNLPKLTPAFKAGKATLRIEQGKTYQEALKIEIDDSDVDLVNVTAVMQLRKRVADEEAGIPPILELSTSNGGLVIDALRSYIIVNISAADTSKLRFARCLFEIEATTPEGIVVGVLRGDVRIMREVVR